MSSEKRTPWWNQDVKEAIRAKKDAYKALLQNRSALDLQSWYLEARKAANSAVKQKQSKEECWEKFGHRLESNYKSANKVIWQTICRLCGKKSNTATFMKDAERNILSDETCILSRGREYFEDFLNPVKVNDLDTHEVIQPEKIEALTAAKVATAIKQLKSGKAAEENKI